MGSIAAQMLKDMNRILYACDTAYQVEIPKSTRLPHQGIGVVIGSDVSLGEKVTIYQNVTLGAKHNGEDYGAPSIGSDVMIECGSTVPGNVTVEDHVKKRASFVCIKDVDYYICVAGNPAKVIGKLEDIK